MLWNRIRNRLYDRGILKSVRSRAFVISVGNLTWGGTGKTAFAATLAQMLMADGYRVAILSRGYGRNTKGARLVSDGSTILEDWRAAGDEPFLLARRLPGVVVAVSEDRAAALPLLDRYSPDIILLDDGFQHRRLLRDLDLVLVNAGENITRLKEIPFGKLREPLESMNRAHAVILTHVNRAVPETSEWIAGYVTVPVFRANYAIDPAATSENGLTGRKVGAFCALGSPEQFFGMLEAAGMTLVFQMKFPDHHKYTVGDLRRLNRAARETGATVLATTAKDGVKIPNNSLRTPLQIVEARLLIEEEPSFRNFLKTRLPPKE